MVIVVRHARGGYPVLIEPGLIGRLPELLALHLPGARHAVISDETVDRLYGGAAGTAERLSFPAGERSKTRETWSGLTDRLLAAGFGRDTGIVALGGGVVGDLAGFVAATLARGVPLVQVPTTLLAMVDASIGGKTGVDTPMGKNLVGAFHPPVAVLTDPEVLRTLPERERRAGLAEAIKHALVADAAHLEWLIANADALLAGETGRLTTVIRRSVEIKAAIVGGDEREAGRRAVLNAGHTVAHALEQVSGYAIPHGHAVGLGLIAEAELARRLGVADRALPDAVRRALNAAGLPVIVPAALDADALMAAMATDKKNREGIPRFALLAAPGQPHRDGTEWTVTARPAEIRGALAAIAAE